MGIRNPSPGEEDGDMANDSAPDRPASVAARPAMDTLSVRCADGTMFRFELRRHGMLMVGTGGAVKIRGFREAVGHLGRKALDAVPSGPRSFLVAWQRAVADRDPGW